MSCCRSNSATESIPIPYMLAYRVVEYLDVTEHVPPRLAERAGGMPPDASSQQAPTAGFIGGHLLGRLETEAQCRQAWLHYRPAAVWPGRTTKAKAAHRN